ncbi:MAG: AMP-binding protein, partial [bacterium]|nr:AMP-binding protein [bacterium]
IQTNEMLRTVFRWQKMENPVQITLKEHKVQPLYIDYTGNKTQNSQQQIEEQHQQIKAKDRQKKFDLQEVPFRVTLCKFAENNYQMIISNHHIIYDGWSNGIILKEFFNTYKTIATGKKDVKQTKTKFKKYVKWLQEQDTSKQEQYWKEYFANLETNPGLSVKTVTTKELETPCKYTRRWETRGQEYAGENKITLAAMLYSAWGILLQKYNNCADIVFGTTVAGRTAKVTGIEDIVGMFINTLPLRVTTQPGETVGNQVKRIDKTLKNRQEHESTSLVKLKENIRLSGAEELFDTIVVIENYPLDKQLRDTQGTASKGVLTPATYAMHEMTNYDLTVAISLKHREIEVNLLYNPGALQKNIIERMAGHYRNILEEIISKHGKAIAEIEIVTEAEKKILLYKYNETATEYPKDKTIHRIFEEQEERTPDRVALVGIRHPASSARHPAPTPPSFMTFPSTKSTTSTPSTKSTQLTYRQLNRRANQLAAQLIQKGVKTGEIVAIMVERSIEMVAGILAILKAGAAYMPINPAYPAGRVKYMLADSTARNLMTTRGILKENHRDTTRQLAHIYLEEQEETKPNEPLQPQPQTRADTLAYVIYTSGTTGK